MLGVLDEVGLEPHDDWAPLHYTRRQYWLTDGPHVADFSRRLLKVSKGVLAGCPLELTPWQRWGVDLIFERRPDGRRRFRRFLMGIGRKNGKAGALTTLTPTAAGWKQHGDLIVGDELFDENGARCRVVLVHPVELGRPCYRVTMSDGASIVVDAEHEWSVIDNKGRELIVTTAEMAATLTVGVRRDRRYRIRVAGPLDLPEVELPIPPYTLGAWLGDGDSDSPIITSPDPDVVASIEDDGYPCRILATRSGLALRYGIGVKGVLRGQLRDAGVLGDKRIPAAYLRASYKQRLALMQGLMDTDGTVNLVGALKVPQCEFCTVRPELAAQVAELARTLGLKPTIIEGEAKLYGRVTGPKFRVAFTAYRDVPVFRLERHLDRLAVRPERRQRSSTRSVVSVEPVPSVPVRCITVDSPSSLYLTGEHMVPTHNSAVGSAIALYALFEDGLGAEVYAAAGDRQQARVVFGEARWQVLNSKVLSEHCKVYKDAIEIPSTGAIFRVLSADAKLQQGLNPSTVLFDEVHIQPSDDLWDALTMGSGARVDPITIGITTAGDLESEEESRQKLCRRLYVYGMRVASGLVDDPSFGFLWWEAPPGCDIRDRMAWMRANPNLALGLMDVEDFESAVMSSTEIAFRRYRLNQWTRPTTCWLPAGTWDMCLETSARVDTTKPFVAAVDMALRHDDAAVALAQEREDGRVVVEARIWSAMEGQVIDVRDVEDHIRHLALTGNLIEVSYDPKFFLQSAMTLMDENVSMVELPQSPQRLVPAVGAAYQSIVSGKLVHNGDPFLADHVLSAQPRHSEGGVTLSKAKTSRKIDGCIAMVLAVGRLVVAEPTIDIASQVL